jgi:uncharacterized protein YaiI (UPF0178 family)
VNNSQQPKKSHSLRNLVVKVIAILQRLNVGNLVNSCNIPLAYEMIVKSGHAVSPRGERYSQDNIKERLNMRDFMDTLRGS